MTNRYGNSSRGKAALAAVLEASKTKANSDEVATRAMAKQQGGSNGESVALLRPDGSEYPGSPFVGGGLHRQTDLAIGPADNVWVMNNWQDINSCFGTPPEAVSTRCGGQGVTISSAWQSQFVHHKSVPLQDCRLD